MASICFDELPNLIAWLLTRQDFPVLPTVMQYAISIALRRKPGFKRQKVSKGLSNHTKRKKNKPKIKKKSNCCG
jgi:hypothetical protein